MALTGNDHIILGRNVPKKDATVGTGPPTLGPNQVAIWTNTITNPDRAQQTVGDLHKVHRWIQSEELKDTAVQQVASMPIGGSDRAIAAATPNAGEVSVYVGANLAAGDLSHSLDRTFKRLIERYLEEAKDT